MPPRARLDAELVRRKLFPSREQAAAAIAEGRVVVNGQPARKPATAITPDTPVTLIDPHRIEWASRGAHKLLGALEAFGDREHYSPPLQVAGRRCLDAGASTGGFTDVLLRAGVASVVAVDVGYGQIVWRLRNDERVRVLDRTNVRSLGPEDIGGPVDLVVSDLSFISLLVVLPALVACLDTAAADPPDLVLLVKPQFEVGRERVGRGGVVRDPQLRAEAVHTVAQRALELGLRVRGVRPSPLPGPSGNVEYLLWLTAPTGELGPTDLPGLEGDALETEIVRQVSSSVASGTGRS